MTGYFITNISLSLLVEEFLKSVNIWQSCSQNGRLCHTGGRHCSDRHCSDSYFATHAHDVPAFTSPGFSTPVIWSHVFQS